MRNFLVPLCWALVILIFSSVPSDDIPDFSFWTLISFDKIAHAGMYGLLSFLTMKACLKQFSSRYIRYNAVKVTSISGIIYGGLIELFQQYALTDRYGDWMDFIADVIGTFVGILIFKMIFSEYVR